MKNFKKFTAAIAATLMAATMVAPMAFNTFAADDDGITSSDEQNPGSEENSTANGETTFELSKPALPEGADLDSIRAIQIFKGNVVGSDFSVEDWSDAVKGVDGATAELIKAAGVTKEDATASDVANALAKVGDDSSLAKAFAAEAVAQLSNANVASVAQKSYDGKVVEFESELETGYYLVVCDAKGATGDNYTAKSLGMLTVAGATSDKKVGTGAAKVGLPEVQKKVSENDDTKYADDNAKYESDASYNDVADWNIGDAVPFKLYGTLPDDYNKYDSYLYQFNDTLDEQFYAPKSVDVNAGDVALTFTKGDDGAYTTDAADTKGVTVTFENGKLTVKIADLKECIAAKSETDIDVVTVEYEAVLNESANVGTEGQQNKVTLTYSNNPNQGGEGDYGTTPEDKVIVFTYDMKFEKTFWNGTSDLTLEEIENGTYEKLKFDLKQGDKVIKVKPCTDDDYDYVIAEEDDEDIVKDGMGLTVIGEGDDRQLVIRIKGLDDGKYTIQERLAEGVEDADGYTTNKSKDYEISAATNNTQEDYDKDIDEKKPIGDITNTYDDDDAKGDGDNDGYADIHNTKGINLPSTGGMGTTLFYLGGGAMVAIAGIFLITKKRMNKEEA